MNLLESNFPLWIEDYAIIGGDLNARLGPIEDLGMFSIRGLRN